MTDVNTMLKQSATRFTTLPPAAKVAIAIFALVAWPYIVAGAIIVALVAITLWVLALVAAEVLKV